MKNEITKAIIILVTLAITFAIDQITDPVKSILIDISPLSVWRLSFDHVLAIMVTMVAAVFSWIIAVVGGYFLGHLVGIATVKKTPSRILNWASNTINHGYTIVYIVPLVITLSLTYALLMHYHTQGRIPAWGVIVGSLSVAGLALGGYQVFKAIYGAVINAGKQRLMLVQSLYSPHVKVTKGGIGHRQHSLVMVSRLSGFEIRSIINAIEIAFHLAVVSVIILETITSNMYELMFPYTGVPPAWLGGAGRLILRAQSDYQFQEIAGILWIVVAFDSVAVVVINMFSYHLWMKYYGKEK